MGYLPLDKCLLNKWMSGELIILFKKSSLSIYTHARNRSRSHGLEPGQAKLARGPLERPGLRLLESP